MAEPAVSAGLTKFLGLINKTPGNSGVTSKNIVLGAPTDATDAEHPTVNSKVSYTFTGRNGKEKLGDLFYSRIDLVEKLADATGAIDTTEAGVLTAEAVVAWLLTKDVQIDAADLTGLPYTPAVEDETDTHSVGVVDGCLNYTGLFDVEVNNLAYNPG